MRNIFCKVILLAALCAPLCAYAEDTTLIVPGENIGFITRDTVEKDITTRLHPSDSTRGMLDIGEGFSRRALIVFPGTSKELAITWKSDKQELSADQRMHAWDGAVVFKNPDFVTITHAHSPWHTRDGITVGTPLADIRRINGIPFTFAGFGWDFSGRIYSWNDGAISSCLGVDIDPGSNPPAETMGDRELDSDADSVKPYGKEMKVKTLYIAFPDVYGGRCN